MPLFESELIVGANDLGHDVKFFGAASGKHLLWDQSSNHLLWKDNTIAVFGDGSDLQIYHDGTQNLITSNTSHIKFLQSFNDGDIIFQSDNGSMKYTAYREDTGAEEYTSIDFGSWIKGIASVDATQVWIASGNEKTIYLHDYGTAWPTQTIEQTIFVDRSLEGLDYQNGFLYVCSQGRIYKCQTSPNFEVVESISLDGYNVHGIAFDGTNFWLYASTSDGTPNRIIKSSLTL